MMNEPGDRVLLEVGRFKAGIFGRFAITVITIAVFFLVLAALYAKIF